ncbi:prephenate dehydrogenase [Botrimarina colliarenosi]|uniref:Prephenate dehydrogenase n=1 Tax=Botrimarina colliarenosi TaxID=2528001 RepID=A0A5C6A7T1_9BACT|nr:prephenate dehydrogenase/arogenate dehydrogenase family protein [Botrimarina colliarenosi]TWT95994.1 prephenate dehydrogenase [Botrimarina colliarenosi]
MPKPPYRRVAVIGVGLIGGSVALALRQRGLAKRVIGVVRSADRVQRVLDCGVVDEATADLESACGGADLVVVTTPVDSIARMAVEAAQHAAPDALVTDGGSTKAAIVAAIDAHWPTDGDGLAFVGAHPLAGGHLSGPDAARADLFEAAVTVLTPSAATPAAALRRARQFWEGLGSTVVEMSPERHDQLVALTSHVPHVAAAAVAATTPAEALALAATGWADTTRVAAGSPELWREILLANAAPIADGLRRLGQELEAYAAALDAGDGDAIQRLLEEGRQRRDALGS